MDSFKKTSGKISIPNAIRFNANEDSIEDVASISQQTETLPNTSNSSQDHSSASASDNWRKEFLQGGFFRKRATSSEDLSATSLPQAQPVPPSESPSSSLGTWKMIKGKVSQAMEDMKSSKNESTSKKTDSGTVTDNDSADEERSLSENESDTEGKQRKTTGTDAFYSKISSAKKKLSKCKITKSTDSSKDLFRDSFDREGSPLRSSFLFKKKSTTTPAPFNTQPVSPPIFTKCAAADNNADSESKKTTPSAPSPELRRRNVGAKVIYKDKPGDLEIESGIEITEEMSLHLSIKNESSPSSQTEHAKGSETWSDEEIPRRNILMKYFLIVAHLFLALLQSTRFTCVSISLMNGIQMSEFVQGFVCSCCISLDIFFFLKQRFGGQYHLKNKVYGADKKAPIHQCTDTLQAKSIRRKATKLTKERADEERQPLSYVGWMNEIKTYDPLNYHASMTRTVYVKLDAAKLRLSSYVRRSESSERVSKRAHWNESLVLENSTENDDNEESDKKTLSLTNHRYYDLLGCQVEMLPLGLARKRHFSRKYPIRLTIGLKNSQSDSPVREDIDLNWFDYEEIKEVSATFLDRERQYASVKDEKLQEKSDATPEPPIQVILFARCDREKEDWYRRFSVASLGTAYCNQNVRSDSNFEADLDCGQFNDLVMINTDDVRKAMTPLRSIDTFRFERNRRGSGRVSSSYSDSNLKEASEKRRSSVIEDGYTTLGDAFNEISNIGLLMTSCAVRGPNDYVKFMSYYQNTTTKVSNDIDSNVGSPDLPANNVASVFRTFLNSRKTRRAQQTATATPNETESNTSTSTPTTPVKTSSPTFSLPAVSPNGGVDIIWLNILMGRIIYSCLKDKQLIVSLQEILKKKLNSIKLPPFMENITVADINLGETAPIIENIIPPMCDERGLWVEADICYEGQMNMTISTKLNLMRLKKEAQVKKIKKEMDESDSSSDDNLDDICSDDETSEKIAGDSAKKVIPKASIYDSDAESSGASSSDSDSLSQSYVDIHHTPESGGKQPTSNAANKEKGGNAASGGSSKKILKIVDRITASQLFQSATEISYVQKAMKNMSTNIRLCFELKGIAGRIIFNIPPPPSDRIWISFRNPPKLTMSATPAVGEHTFDWDIVTNTIESKLYEEVLKILVYPNMVDVILPILGQSTYKEMSTASNQNVCDKMEDKDKLN